MAHDMARRVGQEMRKWTDLPLRDIASYLGGQVIGLRHDQAETRTSMAGLNYRHLETLKDLRERLSEQAQAMQRQLSMGLQGVRRAASEECYPPASVQTVRSYPTRLLQHRRKPTCARPASGVMPEAHGPSPRTWPSFSHHDRLQRTRSTLSPSLELRPMPWESSWAESSYTREDALRYPLSIEAHDTGFRYLFYFMVVAKSLGLRPGDEVLDFGAGSCYVSELLNRFGYMTVALDIDPEVLAIGRERLTLDPRCDRERARFVTGDGMCLPFRDASFDGIICMNALHHMPDYRATLAEMYQGSESRRTGGLCRTRR